jgi:hypothetical protein
MVRADEQADRLAGDPAGLGVVAQAVEDQEIVVLERFELGPLVVARRVLDRQRVEVKLFPQQRDVVVLRALKIEPDEGVGLLEQLADVAGVDRSAERAMGLADDRAARRTLRAGSDRAASNLIVEAIVWSIACADIAP